MEFSHLFIFQLKSWLHGLGPPDSNSGPDLFDLLILNLQHLLAFDLLLLHLLAFDLLPLPLYPSVLMGLRRWCNFMISEIISCTPERPSSTSILQGRHLLVLFAKPTSTSTLCKANTYQYLLQSQYLLILIARPLSTNILWYEMTLSI